MLHVIQNFKTGKLELADVPAPQRPQGFVLVETTASAVSPGTERTMVELARKSLLGKARERPDLVRQVLGKVARDGVLATFSAVQARLDAATPLGYSSVGRVLETDPSIPHVRVGERVACGGAGYAAHAEIVRVPKNLCAAVPSAVSDEDAAYTTIAAIALHGVRVAAPTLGETVVVIGLGLIGLMTVQIARAAGCEVIGVDIAPWRIALARELGASLALHRSEDEVSRIVLDATGGAGADAVIVAASTPSNDPLVLAGEIARPRARVALVGLTGMEIPRKLYYEKELSVSLSTSYGPGRYDPSYEEMGVDYPIGHVRWTEQRNMQEALRLMAQGKLRIAPLRTHAFAIGEAARAYELVTNPGEERVIGVTFTYPEREDKRAGVVQKAGDRPGGLADRIPNALRAIATPRKATERVRVAVIGAGGFVRSTMLPILRAHSRVELAAIVTRGGLQALDLARASGAKAARTDVDGVLADPDIDAVMIATRHDSHAALAIRALAAGKHVYVEKPPAINHRDLQALREALAASNVHLVVGYNRDHAPHTRFLVEQFSQLPPVRQAVIRVNAGAVPGSSWVHDAVEGGGRWIGEGCHFVSLAATLVGGPATRVAALSCRGDSHLRPDENLAVSLSYANGSVATILYTASGDRSFPKERVEVFAGGAVGVIDDFKRAEVTKGGKKREQRGWIADKGHAALVDLFLDACLGRGDPGEARRRAEHWLDATAATLAAARSLESGEMERVDLAMPGAASADGDRASNEAGIPPEHVDTSSEPRALSEEPSA
ncbi:bi-domain-containing oxidoreductase [Sorangium sp. So ce375]|uniref:bi-domain-containing oxidoreductase n=1 Tax=Sorangium sp. So ce375 TaxID=3133306 RepID=UPI003F5C44DE